MSNIRLHAAQSRVFHDLFISHKYRNGVVCASRGFGKSYLGGSAACKIVQELTSIPRWVPNKNGIIVCPTYSQTVDIYYPILAYAFGLEDYAVKYSRDKGYFRFANGAELLLVSGEAIQRQRGKGNYFVLVDELTSFLMKEKDKSDMVESILLPTISTRWSGKRTKEIIAEIAKYEGYLPKLTPGRFMAIGTPAGYDTFYDLYQRSTTDVSWGAYHYDYTRSPYLDAEEISEAADSMDPIRFNREYKARFEDSGGNVFYCFNRDIHVVPKDTIAIHAEEPLHIAIDFNVRKQCSSVWVRRGEFMVGKDYLQGFADTEQLGAAIYGRYVNSDRPASSISCYPDPTGRASKTSASVGKTDLSILQSFGFNVLAKSSSPSLVDSAAAVNARFKSADNPVTGKKGYARAFIEAHCKPVIESVARTKWVDNNTDSAMIDKSLGIEHYSDGIRYMFDFLFPIQTKRTVVRGVNF